MLTNIYTFVFTYMWFWWKYWDEIVNNYYDKTRSLEPRVHRIKMLSNSASSKVQLSKHVDNYAAPISLTLSWTFGSLSLTALVIQIVSGLCLTMHYVPSVELAFDSIEHIMRDVTGGHMIRYIHANGASFYFVCMYCHIFRSLYYKTYVKNIAAWEIGVAILFLSMAAAFLGYVLPWGQMSFWGATVITNLFSVIPFAGQDIVYTLWGGFGVGGPTLNRFYTLHFIIPLLILALVIVHFLMLHSNGSSNPNNLFWGSEAISFGSFYVLKDMFLVSYGLLPYVLFLIYGPNILNHPDNYNPADPMQTPPHIVPEWYFLPFYAILRAIPNKVLGVVFMALSILFLVLLPISSQKEAKYLDKNATSGKLAFWLFFITSLMLGYLGGKPIEWPYNFFSLILFFVYFWSAYAMSAAGEGSSLNFFSFKNLNYNVNSNCRFEKKLTLLTVIIFSLFLYSLSLFLFIVYYSCI